MILECVLTVQPGGTRPACRPPRSSDPVCHLRYYVVVCVRQNWLGGRRSTREGKPIFKAFSAQINLSSLLTHKPTSNFPTSEAHHVCAKWPCFSTFPKLHRAPRDRGMAAEGTFQFPKAEKTREACQTMLFLVTATRS